MSTPHSSPGRPDGPMGRPNPGDPSPGDGLTTTSRRLLVVAAMAGGVVAYFVIGTLRWRAIPVPLTPWSLPLVFGALGLAALAWSRSLARQVAEARGSLPPEAGVRALVLGKTMLLSGVIMAGGHAVYVLANLAALDAPAPRQRVLRGLVTIVASAIFALAGRRIEGACLVEPPHDGEPPQDS